MYICIYKHIYINIYIGIYKAYFGQFQIHKYYAPSSNSL